MSDDRVLVGVFGAVHGVRGEIRLKSYTQDPLAIADYSPLCDEQGNKIEITAARPLKDDLLVVRVRGIDQREAAQALVNRPLYASRSVFPAPEEEEFYYSDLIGLKVELESGEIYGEILNLHNHGAGDILEIRQISGETLLAPFNKATTPTIDLTNGKIIFCPPTYDDSGDHEGDA